MDCMQLTTCLFSLIRRRWSHFLFIILCGFMGSMPALSRAQNAREDLKKISETYRKMDKVTQETEKRLFIDGDMTKPFARSVETLDVSGKSIHLHKTDREIIENDRVVAAIDHKHKVIM